MYLPAVMCGQMENVVIASLNASSKKLILTAVFLIKVCGP
jgi:hypothetical protein